MPAALPIIAAFGAVAEGVAAIGAATTVLGTVAAYATVAGGVLGGIGAITGKKDLMKIGAVLAIGGGLGTWASGAGAATGAAEASASGAVSDLANAATPAIESGATSAGEIAQASAPSVASGLEAAAPTAGAVADATQAAAPLSLAQPATQNVGMLGTSTAPLEVPGGVVAPTVSVDSPTVAGSMANDASSALNTADTAAGSDAARFGKYSNGINPGNISSPLQQWLDKITGGVKSVGQFAKENQGLVTAGGYVLNGMYGPQAQKQAMDQSIYDQQRSNLNSPVRLYYKKGG